MSIRYNQEGFNVRDFGAEGDGVTDDIVAFNNAIAAFGASRSGKLFIPPGVYFLSQTWVIDRRVIIEGVGARFNAGTYLKFNKGRTGISVKFQGGPYAGGGAGSIIRNLVVAHSSGTAAWVASSSYTADLSAVTPTTGILVTTDGVGESFCFVFLCTTSGISDTVEPTWPTTEGATVVDGTAVWTCVYAAGIRMTASAVLENVFVTGIGGDGIAVTASTGDGDNANGFQLTNCIATGCAGRSFFTIGADANAGLILKCTASSNARQGFLDRSFLGNTYVACQADFNGPAGDETGYQTIGLNNRNLLLGCYAESGQASKINGPSMFIGGLQGNHPYGDGNIIRNEFCNSLYFLNDTNNDGTGDSAYIRIGRILGQSTLEFGYSQDGPLTPIAWTYGNVNGAGSQTGWVSQLRAGTQSNFAFSLGNAPEGPGHFWIPNDLYLGTVGLRTKIKQISSGPPTSGAYIGGDIAHEASPHISGMLGWVCLTAGSPGEQAPIQPFGTRSTAVNYVATMKDRYIGVTDTSVARTVTLMPIVAGTPDGFRLLIKDESGNAGKPFLITIMPDGTDQIDGSNAGIFIKTPYGEVELVKRNGKWWTAANQDEGAIVVQASNLALEGTSKVGNTWINTGAGAQVVFTLPIFGNTKPGDKVTFINDTAFGIRVEANILSTINIGGTISGVAGYIETTTVGGLIELVALNTVKWIGKSVTGSWTVV